MLRRVLRLLLEPARDPLRDSFGLSLERVALLRQRLHLQIADLRGRGDAIVDGPFQEQIGRLESAHDKLVEIERRAATELDAHRAQQTLLTARQTAAQAHHHIEDLIAALDDAHARAAALAESVPLE